LIDSQGWKRRIIHVEDRRDTDAVICFDWIEEEIGTNVELYIYKCEGCNIEEIYDMICG
jgi:hypothetical protein